MSLEHLLISHPESISRVEGFDVGPETGPNQVIALLTPHRNSRSSSSVSRVEGFDADSGWVSVRAIANADSDGCPARQLPLLTVAGVWWGHTDSGRASGGALVHADSDGGVWCGHADSGWVSVRVIAHADSDDCPTGQLQRVRYLVAGAQRNC